MDPKVALEWMTKLCVERAGAHKDQPATQEAILHRLNEASRSLRDAITPKEIVSDRDSS